MEAAKPKELGYAFNYIADFGAGQQLQVTGSFPKDVTAEQVDAEVAKFRKVVEKNRRLTKIPDLKASIAKAKMASATACEQIATLDEKARSGNKQLMTQEKNIREQLLIQLDHEAKLIAVAEADLAEIEKEAQ